MISGRQIRTARALLNWDARTLAQRAGLTPETISRIETDTVQPHEKTVSEIFQVFDENGVEFTEGSGVRLKQENVEVMTGTAGFLKFYKATFEQLAKNGGTVMQSGVDESLFVKYQGDYANIYMEQMAKLVKQRSDVKVQILIEEGDYNFVASHYARYRWQPRKYFSPSPFHVVGDRLALISFTHEPAPLVVLIKSASLAEAYRHSFAMAWANARTPPGRKPRAKK